MADRTVYLPYYIVLSDPARVKALQTQYPKGVNRAIAAPAPPATATGGAVIEFAAPFVGYKASVDTGSGPEAATPTEGDHIWTPWWNNHTSVQGEKPYPIDVATFTRKSGGFFGLFGGTTTKYYWIGQFRLAAATEPVAEPGEPELVYAPLAQRHWIDGFNARIGAARLNAVGPVSLSSGRRLGQYGYAAFRTTSPLTAPTMTFRGGGVPTQAGAWQRFYICPRRLPTAAPVSFWRGQMWSGSSCAVKLQVTSGGSILVLGIDSSSFNQWTAATVGRPLVLGQWTRVDLIIEGNSAMTIDENHSHGRLRIYLDAKLELDHTFGNEGTPDSGYASIGRRNQVYERSLLGNVDGTANLLCEFDVADWMEADVPVGRGDRSTWDKAVPYAVGNPVLGRDDHVYRSKVAANLDCDPVSDPARTAKWERFEGLDWLNGSSIVRVRVDAFATGHGGWAGDFRVLNQRLTFPATGGANYLTSNASGAVCAAATDVARVYETVKGAIGIASALVGYRVKSTAGDTAGVGLTVNDGAAPLSASASYDTQTSETNTHLMWRPSGLEAPVVPTSLVVRFTHAPTANTASLAGVYAEVECIGLFGPEDLNADLHPAGKPAMPNPLMLGQHNAPYPSSPWAQDSIAAPGEAPLIIIGGTYVGNGTGQDLTFRAPVHFFKVRPTTAPRQGGAMWWSTGHGSHVDDDIGVSSQHITHAEDDPTFNAGDGEEAQQSRCRLRIAGGHQQSNAAGVTYQYLAICDPGARYLLNTGLVHGLNRPAYDEQLRLANPLYTAQAAMFMFENESGDNGPAWGVKTPDHLVRSLGFVGVAAANDDAIGFEAGALRVLKPWSYNSQTPFVSQFEQGVIALWRTHDGSNDPGEARTFNFGSYVGDGSATKALVVGTGGRRPLWAVVTAQGYASAFFRDPSHPGTESEVASGGGLNASTGIVAGAIDGFTVGSALNLNAIRFHYFVVWGSATAGNGGWSENGEFIPVQVGPPYGPWPDDPDPEDYDPPNIHPEEPGDGGDPGALDDDISAQCLPASTRLVNLALSRAGVSATVADLATEQSAAAAAARTLYVTEIDAVLRDFPWPFATRYADLSAVAGSPTARATADWRYAYRVPPRCLYVRRVVNPSVQLAFDRHPIAFRMGADTSGPLIYCNEPGEQLTAGPVTIEFTLRVPCPAASPDPTFRSAAAWRLAAALAKPLGRDEKDAEAAIKLYLAELEQAKAIHVTEQRTQEGGGPMVAGVDPGLIASDIADACLAASTRLANLALSRAGSDKQIANLRTERTLAADVMRACFSTELDAVLRDFPWPFATEYAALVWVAGAPDAPVNPDWRYAYRAPPQWVAVRRVVDPNRQRRFSRQAIAFRMGQDDAGDLVYCNEPGDRLPVGSAVTVEYTKRVACPAAASDAIFRSAATWRLAAAVAKAVGRDESEADRCLATYLLELGKAKVAHAREEEHQDGLDAGDADWITGRE